MGRSQFIRCVLTALLCVACGCGTVGRMNPLSRFRSGDGNDKPQDVRLADDNPFRGNRSGDTADSDPADERNGAASLDADITRYIADELADATPAERERLTVDFQSLDPLVIKQVLKLRRMRLDVESRRQSSAAVSQTAAASPYQGLGAGFPGDGRHSPPTLPAADSRPQSQPRGASFGHSHSGTGNSSFADVSPRVLNRPSEFQSLPDRSLRNLRKDAPDARRFPGDAASGSPVEVAAFNSAQAERPFVSDSRLQQPQPDPVRQNRGAASGISTANPLQISGIETMPTQPSQAVIPTAEQHQPEAAPSPWRDALQQLILAAEEEAHAAQTAWEQADQLSAGNNADDAARRDLSATRRQDFVEKQVHLRMLYLMSGQQARALERIRGLEPADQEFWTQVMWSLANYFDVEGMPNPDDRATQTIVQLRSAIQHLQQAAKLQIRNVDFCKKISSFGNYESFDNDLFRPGQPVMVYAEIENFASERGSDGLYRTQLKSTIEIHKVTPIGSNVIKTIEFDATTDLCRNHRRDYYHSYELQIPAAATSGSYALVLLVEDQLSRRVATYSRNFTVE